MLFLYTKILDFFPIVFFEKLDISLIYSSLVVFFLLSVSIKLDYVIPVLDFVLSIILYILYYYTYYYTVI